LFAIVAVIGGFVNAIIGNSWESHLVLLVLLVALVQTIPPFFFPTYKHATTKDSQVKQAQISVKEPQNLAMSESSIKSELNGRGERPKLEVDKEITSGSEVDGSPKSSDAGAASAILPCSVSLVSTRFSSSLAPAV